MSSFSVQLLARPGAPHQESGARALQAGFKRHGISAEISTPLNYRHSDLISIWGVRQEHILHAQKHSGGDTLVMEQGYMGDRLEWLSLGFNGLNGHADFGQAPGSDDRGRRFYDHLQPWHESGKVYIISTLR